MQNTQTAPPKVSWTDQIVSKKMRAVKNFIQKHSTELEQDPTSAPTWFSFVLNTFGDPATFRDVNTGGVGAVDIGTDPMMCVVYFFEHFLSHSIHQKKKKI